MEARGKQDLWMTQKPEVLEVLREQAIIQSSESSNRIEGVTVPQERLRPLVIARARPRDRSEQEISGYRAALDWVFTRKRPVPVSPRVILHLHSLAQGGSVGDAGQWKSKEDYYRSLAVCSKGWHKGANEIVPWWNYFLGVLLRAYQEFESKIESAEARPAKSHLVRRAALAQVGPFTLADLAAQFPSASRQLIKKVLAKMKAAGEVRLLGRGRGARWEVSEKG